MTGASTQISAGRPFPSWGSIAICSWLLFPILIVNMVVCTFLVPKMVPQWKASGLQEAPLSWQIAIDLSDMSNHRWYIVFPIVLILAMIATFQAARNRSSSG